MHGRLDSREISDIGDTALSFSEVKALATGNQLLMDKAEADAAVARMQRAERAWLRNQDALGRAIAEHEETIRVLAVRSHEIDASISRRVDTRGGAFAMTIGDLRHDRRADAGRHLKEVLERAVGELDGVRMRAVHPGSIGGFTIAALAERSLGKTTVTIVLDRVPGGEVKLSAADLRAADPAGLVTRLENRLHGLEARKQEALNGTAKAEREIDHARQTLGEPFPRAAQLAEARERARSIDEQLDKLATEPKPADAAQTEPGSGTGGGSQAGQPRRAADARATEPAGPDAGTAHAPAAADREQATPSPQRDPAKPPGPHAGSAPPSDVGARAERGGVEQHPADGARERGPEHDSDLTSAGRAPESSAQEDRGRPWRSPAQTQHDPAQAQPGRDGRSASHVGPPWSEPRSFAQRAEPDARQARYRPPEPSAGPAAGSRQPPSADWRDQVIRSGAETRLPKPIRPSEARMLRSPERGGPEIGM